MTVTFESVEKSAIAIEILDGFLVQGKTLRAAYARPNTADFTETKIVVIGMPNSVEYVERTIATKTTTTTNA